MLSPKRSYEFHDGRTWINDGTSIPAWVRAQVTGGVASNGTLLITTPIGIARVHPGDIVIEHKGQLWSRSPEEVTQLMNGFEAQANLPITAIGPGKEAQFGTRSKAGK